MAFKTLNTYEIEAADPGGFVEERPGDHIDRARAFDTTLVQMRRSAEFRVWRCRTPIINRSLLPSITGLINGLGDVASFDEDATTAKGVLPSSGSTYTQNTSGGKSSGYISVASGDYVEYRTGLPLSSWTILVYKKVSGTWRNYGLTSAGTEYRDGAAGTFNISNWMSTPDAEGDIQLQGKDTAGNAAATDYDHLVWLPYIATAAQLALWTDADYIFPDLPILSLDGDCVRDVAVNVVGHVRRVRRIGASLDGTWDPIHAVVEYDLEEAAPTESAAASSSTSSVLAPTISYSPTEATEGEAYSLTPTTTGSITSYSLTSGSLPGGLSLNTSTGEISGTPTSSGTFSGIEITATGPGGTDTDTFTIEVVADAPPAGYSLWFDGSDIDGDDTDNSAYTDGDPITTWVDKGSLGADVTQSTATAKPTYRAGGGPGGTQDAVEGDGGDYMQSSAFSSAFTQPTQWGVVAKADSGAGDRRIFTGTGGNQNALYDANTSTWHIFAGANADTTYTAVNGQWESFVLDFDGASSESLISGTSATGINAGSQGQESINLFTNAGATGIADGAIADVIGYPTPVTASDIADYFEDHHASTFPV